MIEPAPGLQPVVLGGDIGAYSLARTFHQAYGVRSIVVSTVATGLVRHSRILTNIVEPQMDEPDVVVALLREIAAQHSRSTLVLLGSADWLVRTIVENRDRLDDLYVIPYVDRARLDLATHKDGFGRLCLELGLAYPATVVYQVGAEAPADAGTLRFPVIAKTGNTAAYHHVEFPGKKKVFTVRSATDLTDLMERIAGSGYADSFVIQDRIPGDDSGMRILTCYCDRQGRMRFAAFGQVLLEEHTPGALGNPAGIVTRAEVEVVEQARRLLEHIGWVGWANFDLKYDPRDGRTVFFELNPRLGRSNFYITAAGQNTAELLVREWVQGLDPMPPGVEATLSSEHVYTVLPRPLLFRYIADRGLATWVRGLWRRRAVTNPLWYRAETDPRRLAYLLVAQLNQFRKYARHYPRAVWQAERAES